MDNPHEPRKFTFCLEDEDYAFKGSPCGSEWGECRLCTSRFSVAKRGVSYKCREHAKGKNHQDKVAFHLHRDPNLTFKYEKVHTTEPNTGGNGQCQHEPQSQIDTSNDQPPRDPRDRTYAMEGAIVFHTLSSYQSFASVTDLAKLIAKVYDPKFTCAKTKSNAIFRGVLAPHARKKLERELNVAKYVTIHFDCSNHGEIKLLSILVRFFHFSKGPQTRVLDVLSIPGETAEILATNLIDTINDWNLREKIIAICADNAPTNFGGMTRGGDNNCLERIKSELCMHNIFGIGCLCHIANNCIQNNVKSYIPCKIGSILGNLFGYFNGQTVRWTNFKQMCLNHRNEKDEVDRIVPKRPKNFCKTRWLSLSPALDTLIEMYFVYKTYFAGVQSKKSDPETDKSTIKKIKDFFADDDNYLWVLVVAELAVHFQDAVETIESDKCTILDGIKAIKDLDAQLRNDYVFYYSQTSEPFSTIYLPKKVKEAVDKMDNDKMIAFMACLEKFYIQSSLYLDKWTKYTEEINQLQLEWTNVDTVFSWNDVERSMNVLKKTKRIERVGVNVSELKVECELVIPYVITRITDWNNKDVVEKYKSIPDRWLEVFDHFIELNIELINFRNLIEYLFTLPGHNATVERVFSRIKLYWTTSKSRLSVESVRDFAQVSYNVVSDSCQMFDYIYENPELCKAIKSDDKYHFARKLVMSENLCLGNDEESEPIAVDEPIETLNESNILLSNEVEVNAIDLINQDLGIKCNGSGNNQTKPNKTRKSESRKRIRSPSN